MFHLPNSLVNLEEICTGRQHCNLSGEFDSDSRVRLTSPLRNSVNYIPLFCEMHM